MDQSLLLAVQYVASVEGTTIPWDKVGAILDPRITGGAVTQHLAKLRIRLIAAGDVKVAPALRGSGSKRGGSAFGTPGVSTPGSKQTTNSTPRITPGSSKKRGKIVREDSDDDSDGEYEDTLTKRLKKTKASKPIVKGEVSEHESDELYDIASDEGDMDKVNRHNYVGVGASFTRLDDDDEEEDSEGEDEIAPIEFGSAQADAEEQHRSCPASKLVVLKVPPSVLRSLDEPRMPPITTNNFDSHVQLMRALHQPHTNPNGQEWIATSYNSYDNVPTSLHEPYGMPNLSYFGQQDHGQTIGNINNQYGSMHGYGAYSSIPSMNHHGFGNGSHRWGSAIPNFEIATKDQSSTGTLGRIAGPSQLGNRCLFGDTAHPTFQPYDFAKFSNDMTNPSQAFTACCVVPTYATSNASQYNPQTVHGEDFNAHRPHMQKTYNFSGYNMANPHLPTASLPGQAPESYLRTSSQQDVSQQIDHHGGTKVTQASLGSPFHTSAETFHGHPAPPVSPIAPTAEAMSAPAEPSAIHNLSSDDPSHSPQRSITGQQDVDNLVSDAIEPEEAGSEVEHDTFTSMLNMDAFEPDEVGL